jgi:hypothetical protein
LRSVIGDYVETSTHMSSPTSPSVLSEIGLTFMGTLTGEQEIFIIMFTTIFIFVIIIVELFRSVKWLIGWRVAAELGEFRLKWK